MVLFLINLLLQTFREIHRQILATILSFSIQQVNTNGVISFLEPVETFTPEPFPVADDARMIAPFWSDVDTLKGGTVWYRETTEIDLLERATVEIKTYFPNFFRFKASWIFIATWESVKFYGCSSEGCSKVRIDILNNTVIIIFKIHL